MLLHRTAPLLLLFSLATAALAQTHFCVAGDLEHLTPVQVAECRTKMTSVREAVKRRGAPAGWHFVVVCDETGWSDYATFIAPGRSLRDAAFHTDATQRWTFVRGSRMEADSVDGADTLLAIALRGVPVPRTAPLPNPKRVLRDSMLSVAANEPPPMP